MSTVSRAISMVCVVDDEAMITRSLSLILGREGFDVVSFTNPLEAKDHMRVNPPDLLISDIMMPELSGVDLAIHTAESLPDCRILLVSAAPEEVLRQARAEGHNFRLLQKPVHPKDLLREIDLLDGDVPGQEIIQDRPM
jgi:DNA-binding response OmpR family regulator